MNSLKRALESELKEKRLFDEDVSAALTNRRYSLSQECTGTVLCKNGDWVVNGYLKVAQDEFQFILGL